MLGKWLWIRVVDQFPSESCPVLPLVLNSTSPAKIGATVFAKYETAAFVFCVFCELLQ